MKKVFLVVDLVDEKGNPVYGYGIMYTGVMTRRNIYAKLTHVTGCSYPEYVKVSKWDTHDKTDGWNTVFSKSTRFQHISIPCNIAMDDSRIQKTFDFPDGVLEAIDSHIQENKKTLAEL